MNNKACSLSALQSTKWSPTPLNKSQADASKKPASWAWRPKHSSVVYLLHLLYYLWTNYDAFVTIFVFWLWLAISVSLNFTTLAEQRDGRVTNIWDQLIASHLQAFRRWLFDWLWRELGFLTSFSGMVQHVQQQRWDEDDSAVTICFESCLIPSHSS